MHNNHSHANISVFKQIQNKYTQEYVCVHIYSQNMTQIAKYMQALVI